MDKIIPKTAIIISSSVIAVLLIISGWLGYQNRGIVPLTEQTGDNYESDYTYPEIQEPVISELSPTDVAKPVSETDNISNDIPDPEPPKPTEEKITIKYIKINKATNVRAKDSDNAQKIGVLTSDTEVEYVSESKKRYEIKYSPSKTGWILKTCGEIVEKEITIKHIGSYTSGDPIKMNGCKEGDDIAAILKKYSTTGASVAVIKNGQVAYHYEYGYANKQKKVKVAENTKFRIASVTKVFTSMLAMTEVDEGKLDLDGNLTDIMGFKFYNPSYPKEKVTMRMLLTHTSGLIDRDGEFSNKLKSITHNSNFYVSPPGVKFLYCNLGMGIAGAVVEKAADQTISQYAKDKFLEPMGLDASYDAKYLSDSSLVAECYAGGNVNCSNKYLCRSQEKGKPGDTFHLGQGGLLISSVDLARLFTVLINDGQYNGRQYLSPNALSEMLTDQKIDTGSNFRQCIGIRQSKKLINNRSMYFHNGASYGIFSLMALDPADKSGVVVITSGALTKRNKNTVFAVCDDILNYSYENILK